MTGEQWGAGWAGTAPPGAQCFLRHPSLSEQVLVEKVNFSPQMGGSLISAVSEPRLALDTQCVSFTYELKSFGFFFFLKRKITAFLAGERQQGEGDALVQLQWLRPLSTCALATRYMQLGPCSAMLPPLSPLIGGVCACPRTSPCSCSPAPTASPSCPAPVALRCFRSHWVHRAVLMHMLLVICHLAYSQRSQECTFRFVIPW